MLQSLSLPSNDLVLEHTQNDHCKAVRRFTLRDFLTVIFNYKCLVVSTFLATVLGTLGWLWIRYDDYETSAKIIIKFTRESADPRTSLSPSTTRVLPHEMPDINTEAELIKSYALVSDLVSTLHLDIREPKIPPSALVPRIKFEAKRLYHQATDQLEAVEIGFGLKDSLTPKEKAVMQIVRGLKVETVKDSSVVKVTLASPIKQGAGLIVNTLIDSYKQSRLKLGHISGEANFFTEQAQTSGQQLHEAEERLSALKKHFDISSLSEQTSLILTNRSEAQQVALETENTVTAAEAKANLLQRQLQQLSPTVVTSKMSQRNEQLDHLAQRKADAELERQRLLSKYDSSSPLIEDINAQIARMDQIIARTQETVDQTQTTAVNTNYVDTQKALLETNQFLASSRAKLEGQRKTVADYDDQLAKLRSAEVSWNELSREVALAEENYRLHRRNAHEAKASDALDSHNISSIEVVDPAVDPIVSSGIRKTYLVSSALAVGILLSIGLAFLFDSLDHSVANTEDVETYLGSPLWGSVLLNRRARTAADVVSRSTEDFLPLAAKLEGARHSRNCAVFVFQAASARAGATTVVSGVGTALSHEFGRKTTIVDLESGPVLAALKHKAAPAREISLSAEVNCFFWNISSTLSVASLRGSTPENTPLFSKEVASLLANVPDCEFLLIDAGVSLPAYLRTKLGQTSDGIVVVARWQGTRSEVLERLKEEAKRDKVPIVAGVLNKRRFMIPESIYQML